MKIVVRSSSRDKLVIESPKTAASGRMYEGRLLVLVMMTAEGVYGEPWRLYNATGGKDTAR